MLTIRALGQSFTIRCPDPAAGALIEAGFGAMSEASGGPKPSAAHHYEVERESSGYRIVRGDVVNQEAESAADVVMAIETDVCLELQRSRPDLCFLHAAAVERGGRAFLFAAESGGGKSTTTWGLTHHGFRYLSDELSPVDLASMEVHPYPYALSLKALPPKAFPLPGESLELGRVRLVPARYLQAPKDPGPVPIAGVYLLGFDSDRASPSIERLSAAAASAHLYPVVLNALAHGQCGLDAVVGIARRVPCFALASAELGVTCRLIERHVDDLLATRRGMGQEAPTD